MKASTFFSLVALSFMGTYASFRLIENHIHETVIYPPEILVKPYITLDLPSRNYSSGDWMMGEAVIVRFDFDQPIIYVDHYSEFGAKGETQAYDYSLHLIATGKSLGDHKRLDDPSNTNTSHIMPGRYGFGYDAQHETWRCGGEILDLPENKSLTTPYGGNWISRRNITNFTPSPNIEIGIGMKDWAIRFDGKWSSEMGVYSTGDNLFGLAEKHRLPLSFYTGKWTLIVKGQPILRQRVKNLPSGADFYYSPVYGLVLLSYQNSEDQCTLYMIKTPASGPGVYDGLATSEITIGAQPEQLSGKTVEDQ